MTLTGPFASQVLAAQTRLAQELHQRPEFYDIYLLELLTLFRDKGVAIQNISASVHQNKVTHLLMSIYMQLIRLCPRWKR